MIADVCSCPFCNSMLPPLAAAPPTEKLPCPRCGELIAASQWRIDTVSAAPVVPSTSVPSRGGSGRRKTALVVLSVMLTMAMIGLGFALQTMKARRARDPQPLQQPIAFRYPLELSGLTFVPKDAQMVAGWQIAEMLEDKDKIGPALLADPPGPLDWLAKQIQRTSGLKVTEIDHVLAAFSFDLLSRQMVLVVKTRKDYAPERITPVPGSAKSSHRGRPTYDVSFGLIGTALLWQVDDRTLLYLIRPGSDPKREQLPDLSEPRTIDKILPAPIYQALAERLRKHQFLWAAGRLDQFEPMKKFLALGPGMMTQMDKLEGMKTFAFGLQPGGALTLTGYFQFTGTKKAASFTSFLEGVKMEGGMSSKVSVTPPADPDPWVTWQLRGDKDAMFALLNLGMERK